MKTIATAVISLLLLSLVGCASTLTYPEPQAKDLCVKNDVKIRYNYILKAGRHELTRSLNKRNDYTTDNITGTVSSVHRVSVVRLSETLSTVCMVEFTHEICADVVGLTYCD